MPIRILIVDSYQELSQLSAGFVAEMVRFKPSAVLGLATGSTPIGMYEELVRLHIEQGLDFSKTTTFNLDEYVGLSESHAQSYYTYMRRNFWDCVNIPSDQVHIPRGDAGDLARECEEYEEGIERAGGIDLQVLGIGTNGHIGFNEPGSDFGTKTHVVRLSESTIEANSRFFASSNFVPREAISMGLQTIFRSRRILLLADGESKARAIRQMVTGDVTPQLPASLLKQHADVMLMVTRQAAAELPEDVVKLSGT